MYVGESPNSYSSLWKGYTILSEVRTKLFSSFSTAAVVSFRYRSGMESVRVPLLWVSIYIQAYNAFFPVHYSVNIEYVYMTGFVKLVIYTSFELVLFQLYPTFLMMQVESLLLLIQHLIQLTSPVWCFMLH